MELLLAEYSLARPAGAQTYLATVASHLQRLGHGVTLCAEELGGFSDGLREAGLRVVSLSDADGPCDAVLSQDAVTSYALADRLPATPQLFVMHSAEFEIELPPQVGGTVAQVVVLNERVRARAQAMPLPAPVARLRQPVDFGRFRPRPRQLPGGPRAVVLSNALRGQRRELLAGALADAGIAWEQLGSASGTETLRPEEQLRDADIVVGYGRAVLEGMAAGCAPYVYDLGLDGWVTPGRYSTLEADGFAGFGTDAVVTRERLAADFAAFDPALGVSARELAVTHHNPFAHATALAALLGALEERPAPVDGAAELARMARRNWELERETLHRVFHLYDRVDDLQDRNGALQSELLERGGALQSELLERGDELAETVQELDRVWARLRATEARLDAATQSRSYRAARALASPYDAARRLAGRGG